MAFVPADQKSQLENLTVEVLRDLARNESASPYMRKEATRLLLSRGSSHARHEDLRSYVRELEAEAAAHQEVVEIVETATESEFSPKPESPEDLRAPQPPYEDENDKLWLHSPVSGEWDIPAPKNLPSLPTAAPQGEPQEMKASFSTKDM